jgi:NADP-dependent 3-hydroxy acid dehydrogenase YdfG
MTTAGTAVVSGASRGIGLATSRALAAAGYRVAMLARGADALTAAAGSIGERAVAIVCDVTDGLALDGALARVSDEFGEAPAVLVNNAGFFSLATVDATTVDDFRSAIDVNLVAPFRLVHAFLPAMRARRSGHIVSIGSIADHVAFPENAAYAASKFGVRALHEVLRVELKGSGVRATLVSPSAVDTPLWDPVNPDERPGFTARREMLRAEAVAAAVMFAVTQPADVNVDELRLSGA